MSTERQSTKHGPHLDEAMADEVEPLTEGAPVTGRVREDREPEPSADAEPETRIRDQRGPVTDDGLTLDEVNDRSELARHLSPSWFPARRDALLEAAVTEAAPVTVIEALQQLPESDEVYDNPARAWQAITGHLEHRGDLGDRGGEMPAQQPEVRRSGRSATTPDAPPPESTRTRTATKRTQAPKANRPGNRPKRDQDKPKPERVATELRTRPRDRKEAEANRAASLPQPFRAVAYGVGFAAGTGSKLAEGAWSFGKRTLDRVRNRR